MAGENVNANKPRKAQKMQWIISLLEIYPTHPTPSRGGAWGGAGGVFAARIKQIAALK